MVDVRTIKGAGVPKTLVTAALAELKAIRSKADSFERGDQVWVAFDCDEHPKIKQCLDACKQAGIGVAYSNPCIEQWAIVHFENPVSDAPLTRDQAQRKLEQLMDGYDRKRTKEFNFDQLAPQYDHAVKNAELLLDRRLREGDEFGCPSTTFHKLTETIRLLGNPKKRAR